MGSPQNADDRPRPIHRDIRRGQIGKLEADRTCVDAKNDLDALVCIRELSGGSRGSEEIRVAELRAKGRPKLRGSTASGEEEYADKKHRYGCWFFHDSRQKDPHWDREIESSGRSGFD